MFVNTYNTYKHVCKYMHACTHAHTHIHTHIHTYTCRQKRGGLPAEAKSQNELQIDGPWSTTGGTDPQNFLIYDSGCNSSSRMLIFASPDQLRHLALADTWYMDCNYSMSPRLFKQLSTIRVPLATTAVTCAHALLTGKLFPVGIAYETMYIICRV